MRVLGIESSCDETAAAVVADGERILSSIVASQVLTHERFASVIARDEHTQGWESCFHRLERVLAQGGQ